MDIETKKGKMGRRNNVHKKNHRFNPIPKADFKPDLPDELSTRINRLITAVSSQTGIRGKLVFTETDTMSPEVVFRAAVSTVGASLKFHLDRETNKYHLTLAEEITVSGEYPTKAEARIHLTETLLNNLRKYCFYVVKKTPELEEVSTDGLTKKPEVQVVQPANSKAHQMMLKWGWSGGGLGAQEQGKQLPVAIEIEKSISRAGLGTKNVLGRIEELLKTFAKSDKTSTLIFDSQFSKDERALIHKSAEKLNLKSKSQGKGEERRITISKKVQKWALIEELLRLDNLENKAFKLIIPENFRYLWFVPKI